MEPEMQPALGKKIRLKPEVIKTIKETILEFDNDARIILFGSRTQPYKRGGDIDLLVVSNKIDWRMRRKIKVELYKKLGERKIDILIVDDVKKSAFTEMAYKEGVRI